MTDRSNLAALKQQASNLGLTPYASLYGDRRQRETWEKLLAEASELAPLQPRRQMPDRAQINWKLVIALFVGAIVLGFLLQPLRSKILPIKITIQIGANNEFTTTTVRQR